MWQRLPEEVWAIIIAMLPGVELVRLSHVHRWTWTLLTSASTDAEIWGPRVLCRLPLPNEATLLTWKQTFLCCRVFEFDGLRADYSEPEAEVLIRVIKINLTMEGRLATVASRFGRSDRFSWDLWLCLLPTHRDNQRDDEADRCLGGVVLGQQSQPCGQRGWPYQRAQFIVVDSHCALYCSVIHVKPVVVERLQLKRWYHVALTYDAPTYSQRVYVDGMLVSDELGALYQDWERLRHHQLGSGYYSPGAHSCPNGNYRGWYGFNGLLGEFRMWDRVLSEREVNGLVNGQVPVGTSRADGVCYSLQRDAGVEAETFRQARYSRPTESRWLLECELPISSHRT